MKYVRQYDENACGVSCIATILRMNNINDVNSCEIVEVTKTDKNGTNLYGMSDGLNKFGFETEALKGDVSDFVDSINKGEVSLPCIANVLGESNAMHYVLVEKFHNGKFSIYDPANGKSRISIEDFEEVFTGYIITYEKKSQTKTKSNHIKKSKLELLKGHKIAIVGIVLLSLVVAGIGILGTMVFEVVIDRPQAKYIQVIMTALLVLFLFKALLEFGRTIITSRLSKSIDTMLHKLYNKAITFLPSEKLRIKTTGDYLARFNELGSIREALSSIVLVMFVDGIIVIGSSIVLFLMNKKMLVANLIVTVIYLIVMVLFKAPINKLNNKLMGKSAVSEGFVKECIDGEETIKMTSSKKHIYEKQMKNSEALIKTNYRTTIVESIQGILISTIDNIGLIIILALGLVFARLGQMSIGEVITFYSLSAYFSEPLKNIASLQPTLQEGRVARERLNDIVGLSKEESVGKSLEENINKIELKNVRFRYGNGKTILNNINMTIENNQKVAIVGESGSGKTTIAKLIEGLYRVEDGDILINGCSIYDYAIDEYRESIGVISQDNFLFSDTIKENLILGRDISEEDVVEACKKCNIHDFITSLPLGYDTPLEECGKNLSGGQRQRLCLARAILGKPKLMIMDEGTANLDKHSEEIIIELVKSLDIPCIVITHKASLVKACDCTYCLEGGNMREFNL